jgi:aerobic-type carbon monoxide dehydrogenase small subunit (CoxS/CutS family)
VKYRLRVNRADREVDVPRGTTLLEVLRDDLGLTGTRYGCGRGQCGACYVLADSGRGPRAVASCLLAVDQAAAVEITTIEGLASDGKPSAVQDAFVAEDAMQCGYCTSGMVISAAALLATSPQPSDAEIRDALAGNLCRCGVYTRAIRAVKRAAG